MYSPVFPSSPVCPHVDLGTTFSSSSGPRHRHRALSIGAVAFSKFKSVGKLATATFAKINKSQKPKALPVSKLPCVMPIPVPITAEPFMGFFEIAEAVGPYKHDSSCPLTSATHEATHDEPVIDPYDSNENDTSGPQLDGSHTTRLNFAAPCQTDAKQPPPPWSSPTSSSSASSNAFHFNPGDCISSPPSFLHFEGVSSHSSFVGVDHPTGLPASTPNPDPNVATPQLFRSVCSHELAGSSSFPTSWAPSTPKPGDCEPWRINILESPHALDPSFVPYEFLLSPPVKTRRGAKRAALKL